MAQLGNIELVASNPAVDFRAAIAQNAASYADLLLPEAVSAGRTARCRIKELEIQSVENVGWEVWFFSKQRTGAETIADVAFRGFWTFSASMAVRIAASGLYYYYIPSLDISYDNCDVLPTKDVAQNLRRYLHVALVARESAKSAGDAGNVRVQVTMEPTLGW